MIDNKQTLIRYRIDLANETIDDACLLIRNNRYRSALNRIYYACFYAVTALLMSKDISSKSHSGTKTLFSLHFIETGIIGRDFGRFYSRLFNFRQENDYRYVESIDPENALDLLKNSKKLLKLIKEYLKA